MTQDDSKSSTRYSGCCSFCRKSHLEVGPLAEGYDNTYICYRCIQVCESLIETECQRRGIDLPVTVTPEVAETKEQIKSLVEEISQYARSDCTREQFYTGFLDRVVACLAAVGGAVWFLRPNGQLKLEYELDIRQVGFSEGDKPNERHIRLLGKLLAEGRATIVPPQSTDQEYSTYEETCCANTSDCLLVLGFLKANEETVGIVEIYQRCETHPGAPNTQPSYLRFLMHVCELASLFEQRMRTK